MMKYINMGAAALLIGGVTFLLLYLIMAAIQRFGNSICVKFGFRDNSIDYTTRDTLVGIITIIISVGGFFAFLWILGKLVSFFL